MRTCTGWDDNAPIRYMSAEHTHSAATATSLVFGGRFRQHGFDSLDSGKHKMHLLDKCSTAQQRSSTFSFTETSMFSTRNGTYIIIPFNAYYALPKERHGRR
jgi:hypothetical protein